MELNQAVNIGDFTISPTAREVIAVYDGGRESTRQNMGFHASILLIEVKLDVLF